ncbi:MAG: ABC transporter ATP-binding protein [Clostridia bacterium]|nr:ABC transporter ATP-binding protein [Clostridia bacterium]
MIEVKNVSKRFGQVQALDGVSLQLESPGIYGLLGNNGAGKTTLLNILTSRLYPDAGEVLLDNVPVADNDWALGRFFMLGEKNLYPEDMRVARAFETTRYFYPAFSEDRAKELAERFGLNIKSKITALSTGYRSIFRIVLALCVGAPYLLLDEPVLGLDARHRDLFYKLLIELFAERSCCILLSTHLIQEAAPFIGHAVILHRGRILRNAPAEELLAGAHTVAGPAGAVDAYLASRKVLSVSSLGGLKTAYVEGAKPMTCPAGLEMGRADLQGYFIALMEEESK